MNSPLQNILWCHACSWLMVFLVIDTHESKSRM